MTEQQQSEQQQTGWSNYENQSSVNILKSEYDQKVYILDVPFRRFDYNVLMSLVSKELDTSFINDSETKGLYQIQFENVLEWANMGLPMLAEIRLAKMFGELKLEKSVGGFERILQGSTLTGNVVAKLPSHGGLFPISIVKKEDEGGGGPKLPKLSTDRII